MRDRGERRPWRRRSRVARDRMGCVGAPRPAGPQVDVDVDRGRRGGSGRPSPPPPRLWMGVRWPRGCLPWTRPGCSGAAVADRRMPRKRRSEAATAYRRAWPPRRGRLRGGRARPAARQRGGSSEPRVARMAAGGTVAVGTSRARASAMGTSAIGNRARREREPRERAPDERPSTARGAGDDVNGGRTFPWACGRNILYAAILNTEKNKIVSSFAPLVFYLIVVWPPSPLPQPCSSI